MLRFVALAWDSSVDTQDQLARGVLGRSLAPIAAWHVAFESHGFAVLVHRESLARHLCRPLAGNAGTVIGSVFSAPAGSDSPEEYPEIRRFDEESSRKIVSSAGRYLVTECWGSYLAFLAPSSAESLVLKAPACLIPCHVLRVDGVGIAFSRTEDALDLGLGPVSLNWPYVRAHVRFGSVRCSETALEGVRQILPGECLNLKGHGPARALWDPREIARREPIEDLADAARRVRRTLRGCVRAWASQHRRLVHCLSGGLDSSIVATCLGDFGKQSGEVLLLHSHSPGSRSDERRYARLVAEQAGLTLFEQERSASIKLSDMFGASRTALLYPYYSEITGARRTTQFAQQHGASVTLTGFLGDELFNRGRPIRAARDYVELRGIDRGLVSTALDAALLGRLSLWRVLRHALSSSANSVDLYWQLMSDGGSDLGPSLEEPQAADEPAFMKRFLHPWFQSAAGVPPGKLWQIFGLSFNAFDDPFWTADDVESIHVLMSQPLIELCLRIPTYVHIRDGWDRAVARRAFWDDLPDEVRQRVAKGAVEEHGKDVLANNLDFVREVLLDGQLIKERLLNRRVLEAALSKRPTATSISFGTILDHLSTEIWLQNWQRHRPSASEPKVA